MGYRIDVPEASDGLDVYVSAEWIRGAHRALLVPWMMAESPTDARAKELRADSLRFEALVRRSEREGLTPAEVVERARRWIAESVENGARLVERLDHEHS